MTPLTRNASIGEFVTGLVNESLVGLIAELRRHFSIHPFLFEALTPESIRINWEATEIGWIAPSELSYFETVPKLQEVYQSALCGEVVG